MCVLFNLFFLSFWKSRLVLIFVVNVWKGFNKFLVFVFVFLWHCLWCLGVSLSIWSDLQLPMYIYLWFFFSSDNFVQISIWKFVHKSIMSHFHARKTPWTFSSRRKGIRKYLSLCPTVSFYKEAGFASLCWVLTCVRLCLYICNDHDQFNVGAVKR